MKYSFHQTNSKDKVTSNTLSKKYAYMKKHENAITGQKKDLIPTRLLYIKHELSVTLLIYIITMNISKIYLRRP